MAVGTNLADVVAWLFDADPLQDPTVEQRARLLFLDTLGCMIAGLDRPELGALVDGLARLDRGRVLLPGAKAPLTTDAAAYVIGLASCWDEACEGLPRAHGRPGLHAFAPTLALALARDQSLADALAALVAGFEVAGRLGECLRIRPGMHVDGTWGTFGAVTAAARLLGLSPDLALVALQGAACHLPYSLYLPISRGATVRNSYVGEAARRGLMQALAAEAGITAPTDAVETYDRLALGGDLDAKTLAPAGDWLIHEGYIKLFAGVRHVHYGAQAAIDLRAQNRLDLSAIDDVELHIYGEAITYCANRSPTTAIQAQFSLSYAVSWALLHGDLGPDAYDAESLADPQVRRLEQLVTIVEEPRYAEAGRRAARLTVRSGPSLQTTDVESLPGDAQAPLSIAEIEEKFVKFAGPVVGADKARAIATAISGADASIAVTKILNQASDHSGR